MARVARSVTLVNEFGLHARPISRVLEVVRNHQSAITITWGGIRANGRKMLELLTLAAPHGSVLELDADGDDAERLIDALDQLVRSGFGELDATS